MCLTSFHIWVVGLRDGGAKGGHEMTRDNYEPDFVSTVTSLETISVRTLCLKQKKTCYHFKDHSIFMKHF